MTPLAARTGRQQRGFTAVEIAMVASVIAILALLILPIFRQRAEEARLAAAQDELQSLVKALLLIEADIPGGNHLPQLSDLDNLEAGPNPTFNIGAAPSALPGRTRWFNNVADPVNSGFVVAGVSPTYPFATYTNTVAPRWRGPYIAMRNSITVAQIAAFFPELVQPNGGVITTSLVGADRYPIDPWGTPYLLFGPEGETVYNYRTVISLGPDALPGGTAERGAVGGALPPISWRRQGGLIGAGDDLEFRF